jgi:hypothetical protein
MKKNRDFTPVAKPLFDEEAVLAFASAASKGKQTAVPVANESGGQIQVIVPLSPKLFAALQKEATRKGRTAADMIRKILAKHLDND